jgi:hypothetical protein
MWKVDSEQAFLRHLIANGFLFVGQAENMTSIFAAPALDPGAETKTETAAEAGKVQPAALKDRVVDVLIHILPEAMNASEGLRRTDEWLSDVRSQAEFAKSSCPRKMI